MSKPLKILLIIVAIIAVLAAAVLIMQKFAGSNLEKIAVMTIEDVDLSAIPDGTYTGAYKAFPISVETEVTVSDHAITAVDLIKHVNGQGGAAEAITDSVLQAQSLSVDSISGATYSSKVILLAIRDALTNSAGE